MRNILIVLLVFIAMISIIRHFAPPPESGSITSNEVEEFSITQDKDFCVNYPKSIICTDN